MSLLKHTNRIVDLHLPGTKVTGVTRLTGGVSADVYRLDLRTADGDQDRAVLRIHGDTHNGHNAELEFQLLEALHRSGLPVPKPLGFEASSTQLGHPYVLIEFVEGCSEIAPPSMETCIEIMATELVAVHSLATDCLPELPLRLNPLPELFSFLEATEWSKLRTEPSNLAETSFNGLPVLLHGDYWPENLIWAEGRIAAILDWEDAALGDPLSDVACACLELRYIYGQDGMILFKNAYAKQCEVEQGRFALWLAYVASAALKFMGDWGLEPSREAHMRQVAQEVLAEAADLLAQSAGAQRKAGL